MPLPMLADFAVRLACGLSVLLLATSVRTVPLTFFRTHCQVMLGLLVLGALDLSRIGGDRRLLGLLIAAAVASYFASVAWGIGLPRVGAPLTALIAAATATVLVVVSWRTQPLGWALDASGRLASAFVLGATLTAMLLGHHYLTAPAMSVSPLLRFIRCMGWGLGVRGGLGTVALLAWYYRPSRSVDVSQVSALFLAIRWGMGYLGPIVATILAWKTAAIRSTQSATGILYIAMTLLLFGELMAIIIGRNTGISA